MGKFKINEMDTHEWDIDELPDIKKLRGPHLATCEICGLELYGKSDATYYDWHGGYPEEEVAILIRPKHLDCSYCQKTVMVPLIINS